MRHNTLTCIANCSSSWKPTASGWATRPWCGGTLDALVRQITRLLLGLQQPNPQWSCEAT